jgi:hypothetical protein
MLCPFSRYRASPVSASCAVSIVPDRNRLNRILSTLIQILWLLVEIKYANRLTERHDLNIHWCNLCEGHVKWKQCPNIVAGWLALVRIPQVPASIRGSKNGNTNWDFSWASSALPVKCSPNIQGPSTKTFPGFACMQLPNYIAYVSVFCLLISVAMGEYPAPGGNLFER